MSIITQYPELLALAYDGNEYVAGKDSLPVPRQEGDLSPAIGRGFDLVRTIPVKDRRRWLFWRRTVMATLTLRVVNVSKKGEGASLFLSTDLRWTTIHKEAGYKAYVKCTITNNGVEELLQREALQHPQPILRVLFTKKGRQKRLDEIDQETRRDKELFNPTHEATIPVDWAGYGEFGTPDPWWPQIYFESIVKSAWEQYPDACCMMRSATIRPAIIGQLLAWIKQQPEVTRV